MSSPGNQNEWAERIPRSAEVRAIMQAPLVIQARLCRPSIDMSYSTACNVSISVSRRETVILTLQRSAPAARAAATARPGSSCEIVSPSIRMTYSVSTLRRASRTIWGHETRPVSLEACTRQPSRRSSSTKRRILGLSTLTVSSVRSRKRRRYSPFRKYFGSPKSGTMSV